MLLAVTPVVPQEGNVMSLEHATSRTGRTLLSTRQVMVRMNWSRTTLWRRVRAGKFPAPVETGLNSRGFYEDEVDEAQENLPRVDYAPKETAA